MNTIETERLLLRPWKVDDAAEAASLFRYASDPEIGLRCGWPPHTSVEGSMHDIRNILAVENNWAITIKGRAEQQRACGQHRAHARQPLHRRRRCLRS